MTGVLIKRAGHRDTAEGHVKMEAGIGEIHLQAKECQRLLALPEAEKKTRDGFSPASARGFVALLTP